MSVFEATHDPVLLACWNTLNRIGWHFFTLRHVIEENPSLNMQDLEKRFPSAYHIILSFSSKIPPVGGIFETIKEGIFDSVMMRLDAVWPYRLIVGHAFLDMPPQIFFSLTQILIDWFNVYWAPLENNHNPENRPGKRVLVALTLSIYRAIFPYAMTHDYDHILALLDHWIDVILAWLARYW